MIEITESNFSEIIEKSDKLVVIDLWAEWCGPCKVLAPILEEVSIEYKDKDILICKCDIDNNNEIAIKYSIRNIPTILFIKNGEVIDKMVGVQSREQTTLKIDSLLN